MEYKKFFKNTSMKRGEAKVEVSRQNQMQRAKSRHAMRQTFRNMGCDSDEENDAPPPVESCNDLIQQQQQQQLYQHMTTNNKNLSEEERYRIRLQRLQQFHEQKRRKQQEQRSKQTMPFLPIGCKNIIEPKQISPLVNSALKKVIPLGERLKQANTITVSDKKTPLVKKKYVKSRVDCWRVEKVPCKRTEAEPPRKPLSEKKIVPIKSVERPAIPKPALKRPKETQQPVVLKSVRHALPHSQTKQPEARPLSQKKQQFVFKLKQPSPDAKIVTSTVRKYRKPLTFSFEPKSEIKQQKATLAVVSRADDLFDGISPIEVEPSPLKKSPTKVNDARHSSPIASRVVVPKAEDSLWEPQPVACLSVIDATVHENVSTVVVDSTVAIDGFPVRRDCSVSDWVPAAVHEITGDTIVIDDDDEVFTKTTDHIPHVPEQEVRKRHAALNESFTISVGPAPQSDVPTIVSAEPLTVELSSEQTDQIDHSSQAVPLKEQKSKQSFERDRNCSPKDNQLNGSIIRKRASLIFVEEPIGCAIVPSRSNLTLGEKQRESLEDARKASISGASHRRSSVCLSDPSQSPNELEDVAPPKEVLEKTRFYYDKVDGEVNRLQALCDQYAPYLETELELNDHCRGLIIAAQGQTNILIKKKLSKFRELIGHYEKKWNDRKVRHDDLDGFWVMLALDLDNLDKRFEELRLLQGNNWQEVIPEPQPKVKKLQGGGGVRKREKKPSAAANGKKGSSSAIADLIRKARQEKAKHRTTVEDLDALKETVTVVTVTPVKRSVRFGESPQRTSGVQKRSSLCTGCTPTTVHWDQEPKPDHTKRHTIFPDITQSKSELVKSILKPLSKANRTRRAKSVLFLDAGLDTPQTRRRQSCRSIVDTPKPKIKFNEELEIEHIDNLAARTPSRLDAEIEKRRQQSLLLGQSASRQLSSNADNDVEQQKKVRKPRGTPRHDGSAVRRSNRRSASASSFNAFFDEESINNNDSNAEEDEKGGGTAKRLTRSSKGARKKILDY